MKAFSFARFAGTREIVGTRLASLCGCLDRET